MRSLKKIAAHYWLRPDGSVGKFPIITFDGDNKIVEIRERNTFKEEASLLLVNGFLVPGLVDYNTATLSLDERPTIKKYFNRLYIHGIRVMGVTTNVYAHLKKVSPENILLVQADVTCGIHNLPMGFEAIQEASNSMAQLMSLTIHNAKAMGMDDMYGSLEVGKAPGLLVISNLDYHTFCIDKNSKLKGIL